MNDASNHDSSEQAASDRDATTHDSDHHSNDDSHRATSADARDVVKSESGDPVLRERVIAALKTCYDPEIPVDIYELGLIYDIELDSDANCHINMTLTSPNCPVAGTLPGEVEEKVRGVEGVASAKLELVWDPPWDQTRMSEVAKLELGMF